jgi:hypothetical protein
MPRTTTADASKSLELLDHKQRGERPADLGGQLGMNRGVAFDRGLQAPPVPLQKVVG